MIKRVKVNLVNGDSIDFYLTSERTEKIKEWYRSLTCAHSLAFEDREFILRKENIILFTIKDTSESEEGYSFY